MWYERARCRLGTIGRAMVLSDLMKIQIHKAHRGVKQRKQRSEPDISQRTSKRF